MGPRTNENNIDRSGSSHHDIDEDFENGWTIGYDVQMQGVGVIDVGTSDLSDGNDDDDGCDSNCSFFSDNSDNETKRAGYRLLLCDAVAGETLNGEEIIGERSEYVTPSLSTSKLVEQMPLRPQDNFQREISHKPVDITLDEDKINQIRSAMSKINIKPPPWADFLEDKKLAELVQNLKKSA